MRPLALPRPIAIPLRNPPQTFSPSQLRRHSDLQRISDLQKLKKRRLPLIYSDLTPGNSHALAVSLASFLPPEWTAPWVSRGGRGDAGGLSGAASSDGSASSSPAAADFDPSNPFHNNSAAGTNAGPDLSARASSPAAADFDPSNPFHNSAAGTNAGPDLSARAGIPLPPTNPAVALPPLHHYAYFNPAIPSSALLADGTDPLQAPGEPWVRRMWFGGIFAVNPAMPDFELNGARAVCVEGIRGVNIKGYGPDEKVYVNIERRMGYVKEGEGEEELRERLWGETEEDWREATCKERRTLVFMKEKSKQEAIDEASKAELMRMMEVKKSTRSLEPGTITYTVTPTPSLLFRFSALTFNAHAIHLDPNYCRANEGYRDLLVHGPLSATLLAALLNSQLGPGRRVTYIGYQNLHPLYCNEPIKLCLRKMEETSEVEKYTLWAETPEAYMGARMRAVVRKVPT